MTSHSIPIDLQDTLGMLSHSLFFMTLCIIFYHHFRVDKEKFKNLRNLSEATLLVNGPAMVSMQFFLSGKHTAPLFHIIWWSHTGIGGGRGRNKQ